MMNAVQSIEKFQTELETRGSYVCTVVMVGTDGRLRLWCADGVQNDPFFLQVLMAIEKTCQEQVMLRSPAGRA